MINDTFKGDPKYRQCLRSNCPNGQIHETGSNEPLMTCNMCGYKMCYVHERPWHEGQTCGQYEGCQRRQAEDAASAATIARSSKPCPGDKCSARIEKSEGCDHMTCNGLVSPIIETTNPCQGAKCKFEFCWQCLAAFGPIPKHGNTGHKSTCRYHSDNLPAMALLNPTAYFPNDTRPRPRSR